jgi:tripartite-type tricarboxylate transporter receptor subunit TctC
MPVVHSIGVLLVALAGAVATLINPAYAQYPSKRITLIVPFAAGGSNDILARAIGQKLSESWQVPVVVENQGGASGSIGTTRVAKADPDGHTILILSSTYTINAAVQPNLPFDPSKSFSGVAMLGKAPLMLAVSKRVPARSTQELLTLARAKPGHLNYGSAGLGSVNHMSMELFKHLAALDIKHVPYRAGSLAVNDLIGGHLDMFIGSMPQMMELVRAGTATGIAVTSTERSSAVLELPTLAESGVPKYELEQWWGLVVPAGTPSDVVQKLNTEINRILNTSEITAFMNREGAHVTPSRPEALDRHLGVELQRWVDIVKTMGLRTD